MRNFSRRSAIKTGAAAAALSALPLPSWLEGTALATPYVRYEASTAQGQVMLDKYSQAVAIMKTKAMGDPCSWTFQWYTHWIQGPMSFSTKAPTVATLPAAQQPLANAMWDTCQNHGGQTSEEMFLPWHRMYIYYLEHICRHVLNDNTFTLPYWNYNAAATQSLPSKFLSPANSSNPLWHQYRNATSAAGNPMQYLTLDCLQQTTYSGFSGAIDGNPHGQLHVDVGNSTQGMGTVPWAAADPIFYLHHCNIDRLWASWNAGGNANPTSASWTGQTFTFANPGYAGCTQVTATVGNVTSASALGYSYDRIEPIPGRFRLNWPFGPIKLNPLLKGPGPIELNPHATHVVLTAAPVLLRNLKEPFLTTRLRALPRERRVYLLVDGLMAGEQPGVSYNVYLNPGEKGLEKPGAERLAGTINFFEAVMPAGARHMTPPRFAFDVTGVLTRLQRGGPLADKFTVSIVPTGEPASTAKPMVGGFSFVEA